MNLMNFFLFVTASNERQAFIKNDEIKIKDSLDIAEIDARLNALQKFMNSNVDCI